MLDTDFEENFKGLIQQLSSSLNVGIENLYTALNKNISLQDNVLCTIKDITVTVLADGTPKQTVTVPLSFNSTVTAVMCGKADNLTNSAIFPTSGIFLSFTQYGNSITINNITGLPVGNNFRLKVIIFG